MTALDELIGYAKANSESAALKDDRMTWAAHHRNCLKVKEERESDAKVIAALIATLAPFAASAYDRDWLPPDWEIGTPLRYLRDARAAIAATSEQNVGK